MHNFPLRYFSIILHNIIYAYNSTCASAADKSGGGGKLVTISNNRNRFEYCMPNNRSLIYNMVHTISASAHSLCNIYILLFIITI